MTTYTTTEKSKPATGVPILRVFARTCAAEWTRLWTVKSTWWFLLVAGLIMVGLATVAGLEAGNSPADAENDPAWMAARFTAMPAQFALLALALMAVTSDYASGGIVPALQWTPRRGVLFLARSLVAVGAATVLGAVLATAASITAYLAARPVLDLPFDEGVDALATVAFVFGAGAALAVGLGFLLRNTAGALVSVFLLLLLLPLLLPQLGYKWLTDIADLLPGVGALFLLLEEPIGRGLNSTSAMATMLCWAFGALFLGWLRSWRDHANR